MRYEMFYGLLYCLMHRKLLQVKQITEGIIRSALVKAKEGDQQVGKFL